MKYTAEVAKADKVPRSGRKNAMDEYYDILAIFYLHFLKKLLLKTYFLSVALASSSFWNLTQDVCLIFLILVMLQKLGQSTF